MGGFQSRKCLLSLSIAVGLGLSGTNVLARDFASKQDFYAELGKAQAAADNKPNDLDVAFREIWIEYESDFPARYLRSPDVRRFLRFLELCTEKIEREPHTARYYYYRAVARRHIQDQGMWADLNKTVSLDPLNGSALLYRARQYEDKGEFPSALKDYENLAKLLPAEAAIGRAKIYQRHRSPRAMASIDEAIKIAPHRAEPHKFKANAFIRLGEWQKAIDELDKAIALESFDDNSWVLRGQCHSKLGNLQAAIEDCSKSIEIDSSFNHAMVLRAWMREKSGDISGAWCDYRQALCRSSIDTFEYDKYAELSLRLGETSQCKVTLDYLFEKDRKPSAMAYYLRGQMLLSEQSYQSAVKHFAFAAYSLCFEKQPRAPWWYYY